MSGYAKLIAAAFLAGICVLHAGEVISIRLVEASNRPGAADPTLTDVQEAMTGGRIKFKSLRLLKSATTNIPANFSEEMQPGFFVACKGPQDALKVTVIRKHRVLLKSTVQLADGKPVILGGFRSFGGKLLIVLLSK